MIAGKNKGQKGKVLKVLAAEGRLLVEGINIQKRRQKARRQGEKGQVVEKAMPVAYSNVLVFCDSCGKGVRLGAKVDGKNKTRVCQSCGKAI